MELREGDALKTLALGLPAQVDLLLLDGAKALYPDILRLIEDRLRPGALIVADDADDSPEYLARVRAPRNGYLSTPFAVDVELSVRVGRSEVRGRVKVNPLASRTPRPHENGGPPGSPRPPCRSPPRVWG
ncbi:hypothetical protein QEG98_34025 [Myxococcus sp. MxC21-1]|uniref:O-methyltransferase n=1 Tax=Myxococcus sp. MxC21-1 TaxID=3041439 RepID=UPI0029304ACC|nr:hypothetical protein [Myxococcus sp. MxC21-1]WNZ60901.1 hypothetical protein QEG98_34025 [Myxococcus sp. MxC21-1]